MKKIREWYQARKARQEQEAYRRGFAWACTELLLYERPFEWVLERTKHSTHPFDLGAEVAVNLLQTLEATTTLNLASSFPTMLRKMWSGGEVEHWLMTQADNFKHHIHRTVYARSPDFPRPERHHRS